jgi:hypothetical protein
MNEDGRELVCRLVYFSGGVTARIETISMEERISLCLCRIIKLGG